MESGMEQLEKTVQQGLSAGFERVMARFQGDINSARDFFSDEYHIEAERVIDGGETKDYLVFSAK